jgi:hypothetical protein
MGIYTDMEGQVDCSVEKGEVARWLRVDVD